MTLRPRGPSVALTARASCDNPLAISARASTSKLICLLAICVSDSIRNHEVHEGHEEEQKRFASCPSCSSWFKRLLEHSQQVALAQDDVLGSLDFDFGAAVLAVVDGVAHADGDFHRLA